jgi:hypothetical protein
VVEAFAVPVVSRENAVGQDIVAQEQRRLAVYSGKRWIGTGLVLMDADVVLHRRICKMRLPRPSGANNWLAR